MKTNIGIIQASRNNGYLHLAKTKWSLNTGNITIPGKYDNLGDCYLREICIKIGVPVIDTRFVESCNKIKKPVKLFNEEIGSYIARVKLWAKLNNFDVRIYYIY